VSKLTDPLDPQFVRDFTRGTFSKPVPDAFLDTIVALVQQVPAHVWKAALSGLIEADHSSQLGVITAPVLLVWGSGDPLVPRSQQDALLAAIRGSRLLVYEGAGHAPNWEEPQRFAKDLVAFVQAPR
jgi:pimeloyl-ACP methyl ester carboxylesterase